MLEVRNYCPMCESLLIRIDFNNEGCVLLCCPYCLGAN